MKMTRMRNLLVALAVLAFIVLLVLPSTGWVMRTQLRMLFSTFPEKALTLLSGIKPEILGLSTLEGESIKARAKQLLSQTAQRYPEDEKTQIALCVLTEPYAVFSERLRDLLDRFPKSPLLHAAILRYDYINRIRFDRKERYLLSESPLPKTFRQPDPKHLAAFEKVATNGERIDPDNAFFPMMRAVALFASHRDGEALKALLQASKKQRWDDYVLDESEGVLRLWETTFGKAYGLTKICLLEMRLEPYPIRLKELAYVVAYKAMELERKGKFVEGLKLRLALMRCAKLMREQEKSKLPKLVAPAIAHIATVRPKGESLPEPTEKQEEGKLIQIRFINYLKQLGQNEAAKWTQAELQANQRVREGLMKQVRKSPILDELAFVWSMNLTFLSAVAILLAMWVGAGFVLRVERMAMRKKQIGARAQRPFRLGAILLFAIWLMTIVWLWKVSAIKYVWSVYEVTEDLLGIEKFIIPPQIWQAFLLALVAIGSLTFAFAMGLLGSRKGIPMSRAIVQGIWRWSLLTAATIFLLYAATLIVTSVWEGRVYLHI